MKKFFVTILIAIVCCLFVGCDNGEQPPVDNIESIVVCSAFYDETFYINDTIELKNYTVLVTYESGKTETLELSRFGLSVLDTTTAGNKSLNFTYKEKNFVVNYEVVDIIAINAMYKGIALEFYRGENFDFSSVVVSVLFNNGDESKISLSDFTLSSIDYTLSSDTNTLTATYKGVTVNIPYTVTNRPIVENIDYDFNDTLKIHGDKALKIRFVDGFFILHDGNGNVAVSQTVTSCDYNMFWTYETVNNVFPTTVYFYLVNDTVYCEL